MSNNNNNNDVPEQVGGHGAILSDVSDPTIILKPVEERELKFYVDINQEDDEVLKQICLVFTPKFGGTTEVNDKGKSLIKMENLLTNMNSPCIADLKIGTRQHTAYMTEAKQLGCIEKCKSSTTASLGVRIVGMNRKLNGESVGFKKQEAVKISELQVLQDKIQWFFTGTNGVRKDVVNQIIKKVKQLNELMSVQKTYRFYSSSLLIVYDSDESNVDDNNVPVTHAKMIDFAHSFKLTEENLELIAEIHENEEGIIDSGKTVDIDRGFIHGLNSLTTMLENIVNSED